MPKQILDFDAFLAESEDKTKIIRIFGRDCEVPVELPFTYVLKIEAMLKGKGKRITGEENIALLKRMFRPQDISYIMNHPKFHASDVWNLIAFAWLQGNADAPEEPQDPVFHTEDDLKAEQTRAKTPKKRRSAR